jgi:hypothetical protein
MLRCREPRKLLKEKFQDILLSQLNGMDMYIRGENKKNTQNIDMEIS